METTEPRPLSASLPPPAFAAGGGPLRCSSVVFPKARPLLGIRQRKQARRSPSPPAEFRQHIHIHSSTSARLHTEPGRPHLQLSTLETTPTAAARWRHHWRHHWRHTTGNPLGNTVLKGNSRAESRQTDTRPSPRHPLHVHTSAPRRHPLPYNAPSREHLTRQHHPGHRSLSVVGKSNGFPILRQGRFFAERIRKPFQFNRGSLPGPPRHHLTNHLIHQSRPPD